MVWQEARAVLKLWKRCNHIRKMVLVSGEIPAPFFLLWVFVHKEKVKKINNLIIKLLDIQNKDVYTLIVKTFSRVNSGLRRREKK